MWCLGFAVRWNADELWAPRSMDMNAADSTCFEIWWVHCGSVLRILQEVGGVWVLSNWCSPELNLWCVVLLCSCSMLIWNQALRLTCRSRKPNTCVLLAVGVVVSSFRLHFYLTLILTLTLNHVSWSMIITCIRYKSWGARALSPMWESREARWTSLKPSPGAPFIYWVLR